MSQKRNSVTSFLFCEFWFFGILRITVTDTSHGQPPTAKIHEIFLESREYKGRSDKARELYDLAWKYLKPLWYYKIAALYAQDF